MIDYQYYQLLKYQIRNKFQAWNNIRLLTLYLKQIIQKMSINRYCSPQKQLLSNDSNLTSSTFSGQMLINSTKKLVSKVLTPSCTTSTSQLQDICQLQQSIQSQKLKNYLKYTQIMQTDSSFIHNLYVCNFNVQNVKKLGTQASQQLLLKQLDNLMEENYVFDKYLRKLNEIKHQQKELKQGIQNGLQHNFLFLRNIWKPKTNTSKNYHQNNSQISAQDKLENLSMQVAIIKRNILQKTEIQKTGYQSLSYDASLRQLVKDSQLYKQLQMKFQELTIKYEQQIMIKHEQQLIKSLKSQKFQIGSYNQITKIKELQHQNIKLKNNIQDLKSKILQKQIKQIELQKKLNDLNTSKEQQKNKISYKIQLKVVQQQQKTNQNTLMLQIDINKNFTIKKVQSSNLNCSMEMTTQHSLESVLRFLNSSIPQQALTCHLPLTIKTSNLITQSVYQSQKFKSIDKIYNRDRKPFLSKTKIQQNLNNKSGNNFGFNIQLGQIITDKLKDAKTTRFIRLNSPRRRVSITDRIQ